MKLQMKIEEDFRKDRVDIWCSPIPTGQGRFDYWLFENHIISSGPPHPLKKIVKRLKLDYAI